MYAVYDAVSRFDSLQSVMTAKVCVCVCVYVCVRVCVCVSYAGVANSSDACVVVGNQFQFQAPLYFCKV